MELKLDEFGFPVIAFLPIINENGIKIAFGNELEAIIDTGSFNCFIEPKIISNLGINPTGKKHTFNKLLEGHQTVDTYSLEIHIPSVDRNVQIIASERVGEYPYPLILGTQFLSLFEFKYHGTNKTFELNIIKE